VPAVSLITTELYELVGSLCRPGNVNLVFHVSLHWSKGIRICSLHFLYFTHRFSVRRLYSFQYETPVLMNQLAFKSVERISGCIGAWYGWFIVVKTNMEFSACLKFNPLNPKLNPICYLLALLGAHHFLHVSKIRVKLLTFRLLMSYIYIYGAPILDVSRSHTTTHHSR